MALEQLEESRRVLEQCEPDPRTISCAAMIQRNLGMVTRDERDYARAAEHFREGLNVLRAEQLAAHTLADCLDWIAALAGAEHRPREAAVH